MKIFEFKTTQKQKHQLKGQKATHHVKASNQAEATRMLKTWVGSKNESSTNILSCRQLSGSAAKNINESKLITSENYNRWQNPGSQVKKSTSKNDVDWKAIDNLQHNKEADGFTDEEKEPAKNVNWKVIDQLEHNKEADNF
jgi:hypothetical protein